MRNAPIVLPQEPPVLEGETVRLRAYRDSDASLVAQVVDDRLIPVLTTVPAGGGPAEIAEYIARQHSRLANGEGIQLVIAQCPGDVAVGQMGLTLQGQHRASVGYWVAPGARRRGYVAAALQLFSEWALALPGLDRLELYVEPWNEGSWRAAERAGFEREGLLRSWERVGSEPRDMFMYLRLPGVDA